MPCTASTTVISVLLVLTISGSAIKLPSELFSPLISEKVFAIASKESNPPAYPQYTDRVEGTWKFFDPNNTWTTGFFPAALYALNERKTLCPSLKDNTDWLSLGRQWSTGIIPYETNNGLEHDVGFVSFPFQDELLMCVLVSDIMNNITLSRFKRFE